jgi:Dynamin GTPase effector domain
MQRPFTLRVDCFARFRDEKMAQYDSPPALIEQPQQTQNQRGHTLANAGPPAPVVTLPSPHKDRYKEELVLATMVEAYSHLAAQRVIDNVPMILENELVRKFSHVLSAGLDEKLEIVGPNSAEKCAMFLAEDAIMRQTRQDLERKRGILTEARKLLGEME